MSELSEAISEMRNMRESYDQIGAAAEAYNTGKVQLAENITAKGIPASATETLPELADKVGAIAQTQTILEGGEVMAAQLFGDGALWNLYEVLAQMKSQYMGAGHYAALIVCEYYKGYDSLQLQGADAYYTCDGAFYDYDAIHVWNDADNGKANRWVCFLYQQGGARLDITNTAISPRSMYIGGHIGTIEYFVNGRLTDLVCGVEDTDVIDNFLSRSYTQSWGFNLVLRGIKNMGSTISLPSSGSIILEDLETKPTLTAPNAAYLLIGKIESASQGYAFIIVGANCVEISLPSLKYISQSNNQAIAGSALRRIYMPNLISFTYVPGLNRLVSGSTSKLIDIYVGAMTTGLNIKEWNPIDILSDATKKSQLVDNIKNHILARVSDRTGLSQLTFTVSTNMFNAISGETITWNDEEMTLADAFLTKNWLLAGA